MGQGEAAETAVWVLITQRSQVQILPRYQVKPQVRALLRLRSGALFLSQGVPAVRLFSERDP